METQGQIGLLLLDLDHFKHVNDTLGHGAGDQLLKTFAKRLTDCVRADDFVARLGGDEFAVILKSVDDEDDLCRAGTSILQRLQAPISYEGRTLSGSASIGGALFPRDAESANDLLRNADTALYALKGAGRGGTKLFRSDMRVQLQQAASQLSVARTMLSRDSIVPFFQQKVDLQTGGIVGFEALLRWQHPTRGLQLPGTITESFKDYELASRIGEQMQEAAFVEMRGWLEAGIDFGRVSINAAPSEFLRDDYAERLLERMAAQAIPPQTVEIEVTEHVFLERGAEYVLRALNLLDGAGVRISLDDFGTGSSSLSHLRDFPVDVIKIDQTFVARMGDEPDIGAIVSAVIDLAASLSLEVVAEGIETPAQAALLRRKGCSIGQGYHFGKAVRAGAVPQLLSDSAAATHRRLLATPGPRGIDRQRLRA
jgi:diguanylate cyclase (GGDEF)-like protein